MAEGHHAEVTGNSAETAIQLAYLPQPADTLAGLRVRERVKRTGRVLRITILVVWTAYWLYTSVRYGGINVYATVPFLVVLLTVGGYPRIQAAHVQRIIGWQGEFRVAVSSAGITCRTDHCTLEQKWSVFKGYRETADHFVLLSRDPNMLWVDVLPKRGARDAGDIDRLRAVLAQHTPRV
ncbi:YcxB family protein [Streptomyces sp. NBC_01506]|uniref:YcxB family protein n=1 Tax=Streptomyces sp. NBC_01506 TaxID=2903887 RepID=UPI003865F3A2